MADRYEELERLQRLRESGALSEEEFAVEKRRLLAAPEADAEPRSAKADRRKWLLIALAGLGVLIAIAAGILLGRQAGPGAPEATVPQAEPLNQTADVLNVGAPTAEDVRTLPAEEQAARAFAAAFGSNGRATISLGDERVEFTPGGLTWTPFGAVLVSPGEVLEPAHVSSGKMAVHYLNPVGDRFEVTRSFVPAVESGSFGSVASWNLSRRFGANPVLATTGGGTWQGYSCTVLTLTELTPTGPRELASVPLSYSNAEAVDQGQQSTQMQGKVSTIVKDQSFDVTYTGAKSFTDHYVRSGSHYVLEGGPSQMETC